MSKLVKESLDEQFHKGKDPYSKYRVGTLTRIRNAVQGIEGLKEHRMHNNKIIYYAEKASGLRKALSELGYDPRYASYVDDNIGFENSYFIIDPFGKARGYTSLDPAMLVNIGVDQKPIGINLVTGKQVSQSEIYEFIGEE